MTTASCIQCRVTAETKAHLRAIARRQQLTESAFLRRLVDMTLQSAAAVSPEASGDGVPPVRTARLTIRLLPDDQLLLRERAARRSMPAATYVSVLLRAHLRELAPLPTEELQALKQSVTELRRIGRNLNQIARLGLQSGRAVAPERGDLIAILRACEALRDHVRGLITANVTSWRVGHAEARL